MSADPDWHRKLEAQRRVDRLEQLHGLSPGTPVWVLWVNKWELCTVTEGTRLEVPGAFRLVDPWDIHVKGISKDPPNNER